MSKVTEAKKEQGYVSNPRSCGTCKRMRCDLVEAKRWDGKPGKIEKKNIRCEIGGFAVKVNSSCDKYEKAK